MNAQNLLVIFRRELAAYFNSAVAYIFLIVFILINSGLFMTQFFLIGLAEMRSFFSILPFTLSVFIPAVTKRLWAEERKGNTLELLLTFPMTPHELVLGKFLAGLAFYLVTLATTLSIPVMLMLIGKPDTGVLLGGYLGAVLMGALFLALGIFISGFCHDQIVAFILALVACFGLYLLGTEFVAASLDGWMPGVGNLLQSYVGLAPHFNALAKGVIDIRDLFYFLIATALFLILNGFWMEGRMRPKAKPIFMTAAALAAGIFILSNWFLSGMAFGRLDLSEGRLFTIAQASKKILKDLDAPVAAKLYISPGEKMPTGMKTLEQDIIDKLNEFRIASKGKFQYKILHMEAANVTGAAASDAGIEEQLLQKGIQPFQVQSIEADEVGVRLIYSAISLAYKDRAEEIIPQIMPDNLYDLEYLLISKIFRAGMAELPKVAMVAPFEDRAPDPAMQALMEQLGGGQLGPMREDPYEVLPMALEYEGYEVARVRLTPEDPIPADVETLILLEPEDMTDWQKYAVNRFLVEGGSALIGVQNYTYEYEPTATGVKVTPIEKNPGINPLLAAWGFEVDERVLTDAQHEIVSIAGVAQAGPFQLSVPVKLPIQILVTPTEMNPDISITSRLSPLFYLWGSALRVDEEKLAAQNLKWKPLFLSSHRSWLIPFKPGVWTPDNFKATEESERGPFPLGVLAQGQFKDAFEDKEKPKEFADTKMKPLPGKLILIGNTMIFQKRLIQGGGHLNFFLNAMDALTLGEDLITIRSKQPINRSLGHVSTGAKAFWRFFVTLLTPALIAGFGFMRYFVRRRQKQQYMAAMAREAAF